VSDVLFDSDTKRLRNTLLLVGILEKDFTFLRESHNFKGLAGALAWFNLSKVCSIFLRASFSKYFNQLDVIRLNAGVDEYLVVTEYVSMFVKVLVFVDIERSVHEFALLLVPYLSWVVLVWHNDSYKAVVSFNLGILNSYDKVLTDILGDWTFWKGVILITLASQNTLSSILSFDPFLSEDLRHMLLRLNQTFILSYR